MMQKTNISDVNIDNLVIWKVIGIKTNSQYLTGYLHKVRRLLVLSGYVKKIKVKDKNNKLMPFCINDVKLLEKYKTIWTKMDDLKILNQMLHQSAMKDIWKPK